MNGWLFVAILRFLGGERFRKATPQDYRVHSAFFVLFPILLLTGLKFGRPLLDHHSEAVLWVVVTAGGALFFCTILYWSKHVSAKISWTLGGIVWAVTVFLALNNRLLGP